MTKKDPFENIKEEDLRDFNNKCDECKKEDESVTQNLFLTGFKICKSCRTSKTVFPFIGTTFTILSKIFLSMRKF